MTPRAKPHTRNRHMRVTFPPFHGYEVRVIATKSIVTTARRLKEPTDLSQAGAAFITLDDRPGIGWLVFEHKPDPGYITHEAHHAICALAKHVGTTFDEETFAYLMGHLVERIHKFVKVK